MKRANRPVILQAGFRTSGTWFWSRFRCNPNVVAFCEPLNEALQDLTIDSNRRLTSDLSDLNHPHLEAPYFQEFLGLLKEDGVGIKGYSTEFGVASYFRPIDDLSQGLRDYWQGLFDYAGSLGRQPVLKCNRAQGHAGWLKAKFPNAIQILLRRHPLAQFWSSYQQAVERRNYTFLMIPIWALTTSDSVSIQNLLDHVKIPRLLQGKDGKSLADCFVEIARGLSEKDLFGIFLAFYTLSLAKSEPFADLVIDSEQLAKDENYRSVITKKIRKLTGLQVDLSQCNEDTHYAPFFKSDKGRELLEHGKRVLETLNAEFPASESYVFSRLTVDGNKRWEAERKPPFSIDWLFRP